MKPDRSSPERLLFLDWLRILALGLLIVYHVGMYYVTWGWHLTSPMAAQAGPLLEPLMRLSSPWRMSLLFLVAGAASAFMVRRQGASTGLLRLRARRLLLPLLAGMLVIVPPQSYLQVVHQSGYAGNYLDFLRLYFSGYAGFRDAEGQRLILPTWNHLWFLPYLFLYTALGGLVLRWWPQSLERLSMGVAEALNGAGLILLPVGVLALQRWLLARNFPVTHALVDDPFAHAQYLFMFVLGAALAWHGGTWRRMESVRWLALVLAGVGWALWLATDGGPPTLLRPLAVATQQWCAIVAAIGFAHRHLQRDNAARRWLTEAVFPVYVLHQTLTLLAAAALLPLGLRPAVEGPLLVGATLLGGLAGYEIVRRVSWLRPWFGMGPRRPLMPSAPAGASARLSEAA